MYRIHVDAATVSILPRDTVSAAFSDTLLLCSRFAQSDARDHLRAARARSHDRRSGSAFHARSDQASALRL